jgi:hypothetical protein
VSPIWEIFAPFDEEACVRRGFVAKVGLVAMDDERGWMFKFSFVDVVAFRPAPAEGSFEAAGFRVLAMPM